ncbi:MAG: hypothetical protein ABR511_00140 [Acidimicrobiales bacterium]
MDELRDSQRAAVRAIVDRIYLDVVGVFSVETVERFVTEPSPQLAQARRTVPFERLRASPKSKEFPCPIRSSRGVVRMRPQRWPIADGRRPA